MRKVLLILAFLGFFPVMVAAEELTVAVAANMQFAFEEIQKTYEQKADVKLSPIFSSSGKLTAQIENGAPFDLFLSADMKYPQTVFEKGFAVQEPKIYAYGTLVLWTLKDLDLSSGIESLLNASVQKIALANPETAPYGAQAVNAMTKAGIYEKLQSKLVYGESISQVNQCIVSLAAGVGFTAKSVVLAPDMRSQGKWTEVDPGLYQPIAQGVVILKNAEKNNLETARSFYDYLFSEECRTILAQFGYQLP